MVQKNLMIIIGIVYFIATIAFLYPRKKRIHLHTPEPEIIEREKIVEKPVVKHIVRYHEKPCRKICRNAHNKRKNC